MLRAYRGYRASMGSFGDAVRRRRIHRRIILFTVVMLLRFITFEDEAGESEVLIY